MSAKRSVYRDLAVANTVTMPTDYQTPFAGPPHGPCQRCQINPATHWWCESGAFAMAHGMAVGWCERCVVEVQFNHAYERAKVVNELSDRLRELGGPMQTPAEPPDMIYKKGPDLEALADKIAEMPEADPVDDQLDEVERLDAWAKAAPRFEDDLVKAAPPPPLPGTSYIYDMGSQGNTEGHTMPAPEYASGVPVTPDTHPKKFYQFLPAIKLVSMYFWLGQVETGPAAVLNPESMAPYNVEILQETGQSRDITGWTQLRVTLNQVLLKESTTITGWVKGYASSLVYRG